VLEPYSGRSPYSQHGQRVVMGQRLMQPASDIFLGWVTAGNGRRFYVRPLHDANANVPRNDSAAPDAHAIVNFNMITLHGARLLIAAQIGEFIALAFRTEYCDVGRRQRAGGGGDDGDDNGQPRLVDEIAGSIGSAPAYGRGGRATTGTAGRTLCSPSTMTWSPPDSP